MGESAGVTVTDRVPPRLGFLEPMEPSVLRAGPPHQIGVDAFQDRIQLGAVEPPVVLHPAPHDGIHPPCEVGKVGADVPATGGPDAGQPKRPSVISDIRDGFRVILRHDFLRYTTGWVAITNLVGNSFLL